MTYAAGATLHEHGLAGLQMRTVDDAGIGGDEGKRQRSGLAHRQVGRFVGQQFGIDRRVLGQRALDPANATGHAVDLVPSPEGGDAFANGFDRPCHVDAQHQRQWVLRMCRAAARILVSRGFSPLAAMRTSTWPAPGSGRGTVVSSRGPLCRFSTSACMDILISLVARDMVWA